MNVKLLRKVAKYIMEEPRRLNMGNWLRSAKEVCYLSKSRRPPCGTVACIAGTACIVAGIAKLVPEGKKQVYRLPPDGPLAAQKVLGLTQEEACRLFLVDIEWGDGPFDGVEGHWPEQFAAVYSDEHNTPLKNAKIVVARIEHFIKTKGAE